MERKEGERREAYSNKRWFGFSLSVYKLIHWALENSRPTGLPKSQLCPWQQKLIKEQEESRLSILIRLPQLTCQGWFTWRPGQKQKTVLKNPCFSSTATWTDYSNVTPLVPPPSAMWKLVHTLPFQMVQVCETTKEATWFASLICISLYNPGGKCHSQQCPWHLPCSNWLFLS